MQALKALPQKNRKRRGHDFYPPAAEAKKIPGLNTTDGEEFDDKFVYLHYFGPSQDWYIAEVDQETGLAFGYADLGFGGGEWGSIFLPELEEVAVGFVIIERDKWFLPRRFAGLGE
jgi:hypothetical protein